MASPAETVSAGPGEHPGASGLATPPSPRGTEKSTLILRAQDGDILAFAVLLESYEPDISALCRAILHDEAEAELIVEETFLTIWRRLDSLQNPQDFPSWLHRMAAHHSFFVLRNRHHGRTASQAVAGVPGEVRAIASTLITIPVEEHLAWMLHEVDGQPLADIAEILDVSPERVRERIRRAQRAIVTGTEG